MTLEELAGKKLVLGIAGSRVSPEELRVFQDTHAEGLILFRRNIDSLEGVKSLINGLETALGRKLLVMIDHEGGRVIHLGDGVTTFPDAKAAGIAGKEEWVRRQGEIEAAELSSLGIHMNLAPVLDILPNDWNPAIGTRSYGEDPETVAAMGAARIEGLQSGGVSACAKHYPGLGAAARDPHFEVPIIRKTWKELKAKDLIPFLRAFRADVDAVMSSHPVYSEIETSGCPTTFSRKIIHDFLRLELGFKGAVLSDDLKMGAVSKTASLQEAVSGAARAGHDLLLICSDAEAQRKGFENLLWACKKKEIKTGELEESAERIEKLKSHKQSLPEKTGEAGGEIAGKISRAAATILQDGKGLLPLSPAGCLKNPLGVIFPDLSEVARERFVERELLEPESFIGKLFSQFGVPLGGFQKCPLRPSGSERERLTGFARAQAALLFFCWDAHLFEEIRGLLRALQSPPGRLIVVLMREPRDVKWLESRSAALTAWGFRKCQIEALIGKMFSS